MTEALLYRWDNHESEQEVYDLMFDVAVQLVAEDDRRLLGALIFRIANEWEKNRRAVPEPVVAACHDLVAHLKEEMDVDAALKKILQEKPRSN